MTQIIVFYSFSSDLCVRRWVKADDFNRFKLGRSLDRCFDYGTELLFSEIALRVCQQEGIETRFNHLDTTSFNVSGEYLADTDEQTVEITYGYSKAHRPDLKQVMLEMMVSQDGGIPLIGKAQNGNASDNTVFKARSAALIESFSHSDTPRYLIADSKLYTEDNAENLKSLSFITRIPNTIKRVGETIDRALEADAWETLDDDRKMQTFKVEHYGISQRWHVVFSDTSRQRGIKKVDKQVVKEAQKIDKQRLHLQAKRFNCRQDAQAEAELLAKKWQCHTLKSTQIVEHLGYEGIGRPTKGQSPTVTKYQVIAEKTADEAKIEHLKAKQGCYVIGGNTDPTALSDQEVIEAYKNQHHVEKGFRFLKDPLFFVSSLFVKKPKRIMGLLMVMLLSLLVYGIAERRMRACLAEQQETLTNQIKQDTQTPTLRWVFQLLYGVNRLEISTAEQKQQVIDGMTPLRQKILRLFGKSVADIYQISYG